MIMAGIVPFASAYVELFFIMTSLWMDQYYYVFGFTLIVFLILILSCCELTVLMVYYQLCSENHRWWWFSFFSGGSVAVYLFLYSIAWFQVLQPSTMIITYMLYFGYMFLLSLGIFLVCGAISALMSLWFVRMIFSLVKVD
jgi:transmembrane 9 superfamily protein 2/4